MRIEKPSGSQSTYPRQERRHAIRFPLKSPLRWTLLDRKSGPLTGSGETTNASSNGFAFRSDLALPVGSHLQLDVEWPAELDGHVPMKLVVVGRVVRVDGCIVCVSIEKREFRTAGRKANQPRHES